MRQEPAQVLHDPVELTLDLAFLEDAAAQPRAERLRNPQVTDRERGGAAGLLQVEERLPTGPSAVLDPAERRRRGEVDDLELRDARAEVSGEPGTLPERTVALHVGASRKPLGHAGRVAGQPEHPHHRALAPGA